MARPRTKDRKLGNFGTTNVGTRNAITISQAIQRMKDELARLGVDQYILSSNLVRNKDGSVKGAQAQPADPGVAVYFRLKGKPICMPCDTFTKVEQNIAGIAKHIEATRAIERYGVASMAEMFTGFAALPAPGPRPWRQTLGMGANVPLNRANIEAAYREAAKAAHPDRNGGSHDRMAEVNAAREQALKEIA